jgi:hypothetical protein
MSFKQSSWILLIQILFIYNFALSQNTTTNGTTPSPLPTPTVPSVVLPIPVPQPLPIPSVVPQPRLPVPAPAPFPYVVLHPTTVVAHDPKAVISVPIPLSGVLYAVVNWTELIMQNELTGKYFGCTFQHVREKGLVFDQSNLMIRLYDDFNRSSTSMFWDGGYCTPDSCEGGKNAFLVETDYSRIEDHWVWYIEVVSDPLPEHDKKDMFIMDCEVSWRTITLIGLTIGGSLIFICIIGFCTLCVWPVVIRVMRRNQIEYQEKEKKPKKNKRRYKDAYRKKGVVESVPEVIEVTMSSDDEPGKIVREKEIERSIGEDSKSSEGDDSDVVELE